MKVLLFSQTEKYFKKSGIGRAFFHQKKALELAGVSYTLDPNDTYDLVHINYASTKMIKQFKKLYPIIVHGHSTSQDFRRSFTLWQLFAPLYNKYLTKIYQCADYIITPTRYSKFLIESLDNINAPVYQLSNGIHLDDYTYNDAYVKAFEKHFNMTENDKVVIGVGLLFERKGIHDFIEVARMMPDVQFIWFGNLPKILTSRFIRRHIRQKPKNVMMAGYVDGPVIKGAFSRSDCLFFPSYEENEGIVVLEALASQTPVVLRDIPVYYDWLTDKRHVYKGHHNKEFYELIKHVLNHDQKEIIQNGYQLVQERTLKKIGFGLKSIYEQIIKERR